MFVARSFVCLLLVVLTAGGCHGYAYGPPETACVEMFPYGHHANASNRASPYEIVLSANTYSPGDVIEVTVRSKLSMRAPDGNAWNYGGVFVQVRSLDCEDVDPKGTFFLDADEDYLQTMQCSEAMNNAVRQNIKGTRQQNKFYWTAPATDAGHLVVRATVTYNKALFWNVFSDIIYSPNDNSDREGLAPCAPRTLYDPYEFCPADFPRYNPNGAGVCTYNLAAVILAVASRVLLQKCV